MRIVVAVKHVPDIQADRSFTAEGRVAREGGDGTLNELDECAVEEALRLVEAAGEGEHEIVALTVGPTGAVDAVRRALQMGAHAAVHVCDDAVAGSDVTGTSRALAAAVRTLHAEAPVDVALFGMAALDGLGSVVPALVAAELGWPALTFATRLGADGVTLTIERDVAGARETLAAPAPAVVSVTDAINSPRFPVLAGILAARSIEVRRLDLAAIGLDAAEVGAEGARTRVLTAAPRPPRPEPDIRYDDGSGGRALAEFLIARELV
ncbi:Electron transfer flavoprotein alpha/beta-subunit [Beutenbergia cavernae DSM 12333]|uniref:Electron transfer flavoprotein subunit beta n=1 Tax=Beutenbergia cavernae (strain ATCC BAA-8 / DSM 12333 / CCUG 43141 / JCM 11478 / NBRC 16432 / NCIMB 13614 / HKI 0122) TaxID=471853 RepID=C5C1Y7_BEUC1|nr:electron transfer flavoprotein subunit beta/FixA family protein [Beutenbergia cavernae]ACQ79605.1 Electron transfer flavoprotein alpha/beta-subunit [Beutenbergia cavernae DSM 12333]